MATELERMSNFEDMCDQMMQDLSTLKNAVNGICDDDKSKDSIRDMALRDLSTTSQRFVKLKKQKDQALLQKQKLSDELNRNKQNCRELKKIKEFQDQKIKQLNQERDQLALDKKELTTKHENEVNSLTLQLNNIMTKRMELQKIIDKQMTEMMEKDKIIADLKIKLESQRNETKNQSKGNPRNHSSNNINNNSPINNNNDNSIENKDMEDNDLNSINPYNNNNNNISTVIDNNINNNDYNIYDKYKTWKCSSIQCRFENDGDVYSCDWCGTKRPK